MNARFPPPRPEPSKPFPRGGLTVAEIGLLLALWVVGMIALAWLIA